MPELEKQVAFGDIAEDFQRAVRHTERKSARSSQVQIWRIAFITPGVTGIPSPSGAQQRQKNPAWRRLKTGSSGNSFPQDWHPARSGI